MRSNTEILDDNDESLCLGWINSKIVDYDGDIEMIFKSMDEARKETSIEFCLHIIGQLKCNPENKSSYDENSNESFMIMLPSTIEQRYNLFIKSLEEK